MLSALGSRTVRQATLMREPSHKLSSACDRRASVIDTTPPLAGDTGKQGSVGWTALAPIMEQWWAVVKQHPFLTYSVLVAVTLSILMNYGAIGRQHCVEQAHAFLGGHIDIRSHQHELNDLASYHGKYYVVNPPLPSVL